MKTSNSTKKLKCSFYFLPAGNGDCVLIQYQDDDSAYRNILIDGGNRNQLEFQQQKRKILEILDEGRKGRLDLVIVTHSDDDHIKGILKLVMDKQLEGYVDKFWFNSEKTISELLFSPFQHTQPYLVDEQASGAERSSRNQDHDLYHELDKNNKWDHEVISFPKEEVIGNLKLTVLSPTIEKLQKLDEHWPQMPLNAKNVSRSAKCVSDHNQSLNQLMKGLDSFEEDVSPVNGASIALMLEWCSRRYLLLSDSHPSVIVDSLADFIPENKEALDFDLVKVSHHG
ncbi:MBL fold metallo-hydrolase, partial [Aliivibrio sifiae]